jgi:hypothetical protein
MKSTIPNPPTAFRPGLPESRLQMQVDHPIGKAGIQRAEHAAGGSLVHQLLLLARRLHLNHKRVAGGRGKTKATNLYISFASRDLFRHLVETYRRRNARAPRK